MVEPNGDVTKGKDANRKREQEFLVMIKEMHGGGVYGITSNEDDGVTSNEDDGITMVETWMDVTYQDGNRTKMEEVAVQHWDGDQIIKERFYYNMP